MKEKRHGNCGKMIDLPFYKNKHVLVTGHTGFKGSWLCHVLKKAGAKVYGYSLEPPTDPSLFDISNVSKFTTSEIGDICDFEHLSSFFKQAQPEIVFHLAAQPIVREGYSHPRETYQTNVIGTVNILECVRNTNCVKSFLNITTDKVYYNDESGRHYEETDALDGFDPYSNSKSCSELVTGSYRRSFFKDRNCSISTARAGNVIGGGDFAKDRIIPDCIRAATSHTDIQIRNPNSIRPYQHVLEPLAAYLAIAAEQEKDPSKAGSYNVGPNEEDCTTTGELASLFCQCWGDDTKWKAIDEHGPHEANFLKLNSSKLHSTFNIVPKWHMKQAVQKTVEWTKAWISGCDMEETMAQQIDTYFE